jgi:hypothetical protein
MPEEVVVAAQQEAVPTAPVVTPEAPKASEGQAAPAEGAQGVQNTGEQATTKAPEGGEKEEITPEQAAKREGRRFGRKLDAAYRRAAEEKARADFLERQLQETRQQTAPQAAPGAPKLEQFQTVDEYEAAAAKFHREQALRDYQQQQVHAVQQREVERLNAEWEKKAERGASKYDDFDTVVGDLKPINAVAVALMEADNGDEIAYYLMKHPAEFQRIAAMPIVSQVRAIGKLEVKLASEEKPKTPSKAPAPITPVTGKSSAGDEMPSDKDDINTWMKKENARWKKSMEMR